MYRFAIVIFFATLCLPVLQSATGWLPDPPIDENRVPARWPATNVASDPVGYFQQAEAWFDDRFGLRPFLIRLKTQIDFSVFDTSTRVHVGHDGWLFYRSVLDDEKPGMERFLAANGTAVDAGIRNLAHTLQSRGVQLVIMPVLLGDVYYGNELPPTVPNLPRPSLFELAIRRWHDLPGIMLIDPAPVLWQTKRARPIFQKTDFHWNDPAAFDVARVVVDKIAAREGRVVPFFDHTLKIRTLRYTGMESKFLPLFRQPSEITLALDKTWTEDQLRREKNTGVFEWVTRNTETSNRPLPPLCVVGDSFFDGLRHSGIENFFRSIYFARWVAPDNLDRVLMHLPQECRYLLVEFIEVQSRATGEFSRYASADKIHMQQIADRDALAGQHVNSSRGRALDKNAVPVRVPN